MSKHLSKEVMWRWLEQDKSGWSNFYLFLESIAKTAKKQLTFDSIMSALSREMGDKPNDFKMSSGEKVEDWDPGQDRGGQLEEDPGGQVRGGGWSH